MISMRILVFVLLFFVLGCGNSYKKKHILAFVATYGNANFNFAYNKSITFRGNDNDGGAIVFITDETFVKKECLAPFIVIIDAKTQKIKSTSKRLLGENCFINDSIMISASKQFLSCRVGFLSVDENENVYVSTNIAERPTLIRFSNLEYKTELYDEWKCIESNWYTSE